MQENLSKDLAFFRRRSAEYYNKNRIGGPQLKKGDKVYLLRRNIKTIRPLEKLNYLQLRLFKIQEVRGLVTFKLELPKSMKIYPVFYILLLEKVPKQAKLYTQVLKLQLTDNLEYKI